MSPLLIHELRVMSPRNLVGVVHLPFLRSIVNGGLHTNANFVHIHYYRKNKQIIYIFIMVFFHKKL